MRAALVVPAALAAALVIASPASAGTRSCGSGGTVDEVFFLSQVKATNYPCSKAKRFARAFETSGGRTCEIKVRCTFRSFACRSVGTEDSFIKHRCASGARVVRWRTEEG